MGLAVPSSGVNVRLYLPSGDHQPYPAIPNFLPYSIMVLVV